MTRAIAKLSVVAPSTRMFMWFHAALGSSDRWSHVKRLDLAPGYAISSHPELRIQKRHTERHQAHS